MSSWESDVGRRGVFSGRSRSRLARGFRPCAWLLTNTTYGTWLPGDDRGSVTSVRDIRPWEPPSEVRLEHDLPGEPYEAAIPELAASTRDRMTGPPVYLDSETAGVLLLQFRETAAYRRWELAAVAVMYNHFHLVVRVPDDPDPRKVLADFKAYGSRSLNRRYGEPPSGTWWTTNGSKRKLPDDRAVVSATNYVLKKQPNPLVVWSPTDEPGEPGASATGGVHTRTANANERGETPVANAPGSPGGARRR